MKIELYCPRCACRLVAAPDTPWFDLVGQMTEEGPWFALANGETFEEMVWGAILTRGFILCPECEGPVSVREQSLGRLIDNYQQETGIGAASRKTCQEE
jgi:hypothetical protein